MKISYFQILFLFCTITSWLEGGQKGEDSGNALSYRNKRHGHMHVRPHHKHHVPERVHREHKTVIFENFNKEQQAVYNEIHDLQRIIRKNMYALGQERRNIKNVTTSDARKALQVNINKICNEIKQNIEEHQPRIIDAIDTLP